MAYNKTVWTERLEEFPNRFLKSEETPSTVTLTRNPGEVLQEGTKFSIGVMQNLEDGVEANDLAIQDHETRIEDLEDTEIIYIGEAGAPAFLNGWDNAVAGRELRLIKRGKTISLCGYIYQSSWIGNSAIFDIPSTLQSSYSRAFPCVGTLAGGLRSVEAVIYSSSVSYRNVTTNQYNSTGLPLNIELTWVLED